jgi:hypothetical protein
MISLDDLFPGSGIAPNAATHKQSDNLGFIQNQTPSLEGVSRYRLLKNSSFVSSSFVSGYRFSDTANSSKSEAPLGAGSDRRRRLPSTAQQKYVSVGQEVPLNHEASDCSRRKGRLRPI